MRLIDLKEILGFIETASQKTEKAVNLKKHEIDKF